MLEESFTESSLKNFKTSKSSIGDLPKLLIFSTALFRANGKKDYKSVVFEFSDYTLYLKFKIKDRV
jgi:hypothetical protein